MIHTHATVTSYVTAAVVTRTGSKLQVIQQRNINSRRPIMLYFMTETSFSMQFDFDLYELRVEQRDGMH